MYTSREGLAGDVMLFCRPFTLSPTRIEAHLGSRKSKFETGKSAIDNRQLRSSLGNLPRKRIHFSTFEAGMYLKTNKTRENVTPIVESQHPTCLGFLDENGSWRQKGSNYRSPERRSVGRSLCFNRLGHAKGGRRTGKVNTRILAFSPGGHDVYEKAGTYREFGRFA